MRINVINIGSYYISGVSAIVESHERGEPNTIRITNYGYSKSEGIREGYVNDKEKFKRSVIETLDKMRNGQEFKNEAFYVALTGSYIKGTSHSVPRAFKSDMHTISPDDIARIVESSKSIPISQDYEVISVHPNRFTIDETSSTRRPLNLKGRKLEMQSYVVYAESSKIDNINSALAELGVATAGVVFQPISAGYAVMSRSEMEYGLSVVIDIGHNTTDVAIWKSGDLVHASSLPIAGMHITKDIMIGLNLRNYETADQLKLTQGVAREDLVQEDDIITVSGLKNGRAVQLPRRVLARIIYARLYEIFYHVNNILSAYRDNNTIPVNVTLVGGSSSIEGIEKLAHSVLKASVATGEISGFTNVPPDFQSPSFASTLGTIKLIVENKLTTGGFISPDKKSEGKEGFKKLFGKLRKVKEFIDREG